MFGIAFVPETECYNIASGTWSTKPNIPTPRAGSAGGLTCDGKLVVIGGEGGGGTFREVEVFDGSSWTSLPSIVRKRHGTGLAVNCDCNEWYIAGGAGKQGARPLLTRDERYRPEDSTCAYA